MKKIFLILLTISKIESYSTLDLLSLAATTAESEINDNLRESAFALYEKLPTNQQTVGKIQLRALFNKNKDLTETKLREYQSKKPATGPTPEQLSAATGAQKQYAQEVVKAAAGNTTDDLFVKTLTDSSYPAMKYLDKRPEKERKQAALVVSQRYAKLAA